MTKFETLLLMKLLCIMDIEAYYLLLKFPDKFKEKASIWCYPQVISIF